MRNVKLPLLHHNNTALFQSQEFCSEIFLQNRIKENQDNYKTGRLEERHNYKNRRLAIHDIIKRGNLEAIMGQEYESKDKIPFWEKYTLSIDEAAAYFRIGRDRLYKLVNENPDADFVLWNGTRAQIKRKKFEQYIDKLNVL